MVDIKWSVDRALEFFKSVYPVPHNGVLVEEVEVSDDGKYWLITLGYDVAVTSEGKALHGIASVFEQKARREYKIFKIDRETGEVKAMNIRKV